MSNPGDMEKAFLGLRQEYQELIDYRDHWMSAWWRILIFLPILLWAWRFRYSNWEGRFNALYEDEFLPEMRRTYTLLEKRAKKGDRPYVALLAEIDQWRAERDRIDTLD